MEIWQQKAEFYLMPLRHSVFAVEEKEIIFVAYLKLMAHGLPRKNAEMYKENIFADGDLATDNGILSEDFAP